MEQQQQQHIKMAQTSLLQGKRFYCREWVFHKIQHCLQEKSNNLSGGVTSPPTKQPALTAPGGGGVSNAGTLTSASTKSGSSWGVLLVGGPGSGKTAVCTELLWPTSTQGAHRGLQQHGLAFHFCRADDADTLCVGAFIRGLVAQICGSGLLPGYEEKVRDPTVQSVLQPGECERNPTEAFKRYVVGSASLRRLFFLSLLFLQLHNLSFFPLFLATSREVVHQVRILGEADGLIDQIPCLVYRFTGQSTFYLLMHFRHCFSPLRETFFH